MHEDDKPTRRFSSRVEDYVKYRPSYPTAVLTCLIEECGLTQTAVVADVGSGTGLLAKLFLEFGNSVFCIEPNPEMRQAGERYLALYDRFTSINGTAEATTLADRAVDFVVAGQAAHWFDAEPARVEFCRILKPGGIIALVWNSRNVVGEPNHQPLVTALRQLFADFQVDGRVTPLYTTDLYFNQVPE